VGIRTESAQPDDVTTVTGALRVNYTSMTMSMDRADPSLRPALDAAVGIHPAAGIHSYIPKRRVTVAGARASALTLQAGFIPPCLPMQAPGAPSGGDWLHEIKHAGYRIIARHDGRRVRLYSRSGDDLTHRYPLIVDAMAKLPPCTLDGEAIACDENGSASFDLLQRRQRDHRVFLYAFDLIELDGEDRRRDTLAHRKADLGGLLAGAAPGLLPTQWIDGSESDGPAVFAHACAVGLAGIVSKRKDSRYISGRSPYWLKMENPAHAAAQWDAGFDDSELAFCGPDDAGPLEPPEPPARAAWKVGALSTRFVLRLQLPFVRRDERADLVGHVQ
jgi:bifunctional non-homologous end joining protein LigD